MKPVEPDNSKLQADEPQRRSPGRTAYAYAPGSRVLAGYVIKRGLGQGGFGEVYYAVSDAGKDVALKLVRRNLEVELRGVMQCLNVKHPNLIGLYDVKVDDQENHWIVMEYVAGERLTEIIERNPQGLPPAEAIKILRGIGAGVGYLHDAGIVHRDLKPANIFVENGFIKIGDYGLSKFISSSRRSGQTESVGTVHYMAPEIANGRYGKQIDIYALGVLFCELLTGKLPFDGESVGEILMKHLTAEPDLAAVAEPYRAAIASALKKDPEDRPRSVAAFLEAIDPTADSVALAAATAPIAMSRAAAATNRASRADFDRQPTATGTRPTWFRLFPWSEAGPGAVFLAAVFVLFVLARAGASAIAVVGTMAVMWVLFFGSLFRFVRGRMGYGAAARGVDEHLALRATEAHPGADSAPSRFGRWMAVGAGVLAVMVMAFWSIASHRTVERREPISNGGTAIPALPTNSTNGKIGAGPPSSSFEAATYDAVRWRKVGLLSLVAVGAIVGLSIAIGRRSRTAPAEGRPPQLPAMPTAQGPPTFRSWAIDLTGSILLMFGATIVINRLLMLVLVDQLGVTTYLWSTATTFTAVALTALAIKAMRYLDRESSGRRLMFFAVGVAVGAASWAFAEYLGYPLPLDGGWSRLRVGIKTSSWPECYVDGVPTVLAYMGYYGLSFLAIDWWNMTIPKRTSRWRIGDAFVAVFWAGAVHFLFPFPQPWGVLTAAGTALVLPFAFPLPPKASRARAAQKGFGGHYA
jgi:hypothetical protein